jgi:hypothetical protein
MSLMARDWSHDVSPASWSADGPANPRHGEQKSYMFDRAPELLADKIGEILPL